MLSDAQAIIAWATVALVAVIVGLLGITAENSGQRHDPYTVQESCTDVDGHIVTYVDSDHIKHHVCKTQP